MALYPVVAAVADYGDFNKEPSSSVCVCVVCSRCLNVLYIYIFFLRIESYTPPYINWLITSNHQAFSVKKYSMTALRKEIHSFTKYVTGIH
jgi:hypothetical protein